MGQFSKVLLAIDDAHTVPQRALDCGPDYGGLKKVMAKTTFICSRLRHKSCNFTKLASTMLIQSVYTWC